MLQSDDISQQGRVRSYLAHNWGLFARVLVLVCLGGLMYTISGGFPPRLWTLLLHTAPDEGFIRMTLSVQLLCLLCAWIILGVLLVSTGRAIVRAFVPFRQHISSPDTDTDEQELIAALEKPPFETLQPIVLTPMRERVESARTRLGEKPTPLAWIEEPLPAYGSTPQHKVVEEAHEAETVEVPVSSPAQEKPTPQQRLEECYQRLLREGMTPETITVTMLRSATRIKSETASVFLREKRASSVQVPAPLQDASLNVSTRTHEGRKRPHNEDSVLSVTQNTRRLFAIADGMGGHANGAQASRFTIEALAKAFTETLATLEEELAPERLVACVYDIHTRLLAQNTDSVGVEQMGTTLAAALVIGHKAYIVNVGDSRTYWYSPIYDLTRITRDHSVVQQLIERGELTEEQRYTDARRSHIYSCLGQEQEDFALDAFVATLSPGDILLLCSDGLWEMVRDAKIERTLATADMQSLDEISQSLLDQALTNGGEDNVSLIVYRL